MCNASLRGSASSDQRERERETEDSSPIKNEDRSRERERERMVEIKPKRDIKSLKKSYGSIRKNLQLFRPSLHIISVPALNFLTINHISPLSKYLCICWFSFTF